ncbi:MAG TPA: YHS domain-containing protein [Candidatus Methanoperedenaceae archaeon]|nr:YHS domain-containing protein [Candidatus Methanoperedenaceae archaeon]
MPIDPVCWMHVDRNSEIRTEYSGQTYYFCSLRCKQEFEKNLKNYLGVKSPMKMPENGTG